MTCLLVSEDLEKLGSGSLKRLERGQIADMQPSGRLRTQGVSRISLGRDAERSPTCASRPNRALNGDCLIPEW